MKVDKDLVCCKNCINEPVCEVGRCNEDPLTYECKKGCIACSCQGFDDTLPFTVLVELFLNGTEADKEQVRKVITAAIDKEILDKIKDIPPPTEEILKRMKEEKQ